MKLVIGSVFAAAGASVCCIGPVLLSALGAGALSAAAAQFEVYRPIFLTLTVALLGAGFYTTYGQPPATSCDPDGTCRPGSKRAAKIVLWLATVLIILLVTFPYYIGFLV